MSFASPRYLLFLAATALLHRTCPRRWRWALLLAGSLFFYACWSVPLTGLILGVAALTWGCGLLLGHSATKAQRGLWRGLAVAGCAGLLVWFKYFNFLADTFARIAGGTWTSLDILLPVGCSFYTFQAMSYVLDVGRGRLRPVRHFGHYTSYILFFPQLVAGPIERAGTLMPQLIQGNAASAGDLRRGLRLLVSGYFRKLVIADLAAPAVDRVFAAAAPDGSAVFLALVLFAFQIYCDFSGYSEIAQGSAYLMGIRLRRNFDRPYLAGTWRGFWRRWHISLTDWFTDYVYIPLGGSRQGPLRQAAATLLVFLLSGLWHGADWTFVLWGLWHGLLCAAEVLLGHQELPRRSAAAAAQRLLTLSAVLLSWLLFRADSLTQAGLLLGRLLSAWDLRAGVRLLGLGWPGAACLVLGLSRLPQLDRLSRDRPVPDAALFFLALSAALAWFVRASAQGSNAFIYFQF